MILKARFTQDLVTLNRLLASYPFRGSSFFVEAVYTNQSAIVGTDRDVMQFIGYVASKGEAGLEYVSRV